jgi:hypothetical protein
MKFFIAEANIGGNATRAQAEEVVKLLNEKGYDVEYGIGNNKATDISEFGQEERLQESFTDDFLACLDRLGL